MKLVTFFIDEEEKLGVLNKDETKVIEIDGLVEGEYLDMIDLIEYGSDEDFKAIKKASRTKGTAQNSYDLDDVILLAPIPWPEHDIICLGVNYADHLEEAKKDMKGEFATPTHAVYFSKRASSIIGPGEKIQGRFDIDPELDYEVELAVIIGKMGNDIPPEQAEAYIFGYSVFNDISSRQVQKAHQQWFRGKSFDTYAAMGPCILTKDELPFPVHVDVKSYVNGELRQSSNTKMLIHDIPHIIAELSAGITLEPGDIIVTGTPAGVGMGFSPPRYLKAGDTVTVEIPEIGKLVNEVK